MIVIGLVVAGLALVAFARTTRDAQASPTLQDHWHQAYTLFDCVAGTALPPFDSQFDPDGIHSHQDSLIHVHPFTASVTGREAKMGVFLETMGATVEPEAITLPGGETLEAGAQCDGSPSEIVIAVWNDGLDPSGEPDLIVRDDFADIVFDAPNKAYTIARVVQGEAPPPPDDTVIETLVGTAGLSRDEQIEPPNRSAVPGPQDFGTGTGPEAETPAADSAPAGDDPAQDPATPADGGTDGATGTDEDG